MLAFFEALSRRAETAGDRPAIMSVDRALSYRTLVERVRGLAQAAAPLPRRLGLLFANGPDHIVCDLALSFAGKELIPLPDFFSDAQLTHIIRSTGLSAAVVDPHSAARARRLGLTGHRLQGEEAPALAPARDTTRIIFTSGTTGKPKGVCLAGRQMLASVAALAQASGASAADRYLSVLPKALLLEQIAGIYLPLSVGASIVTGSGAATASPGSALALAAQQSQATATVLVPELLAAWLKELEALGQSAPSSLRFIAVGGAPIPQQLARAAWEQGLPVYEGYGLSECSSVVAVNRPDARRPGTVGRPLAGVEVAIDAGEIVVGGPTVMRGYVGEPPLSGSWRTGDLGYFDSDGFLVVTGRKDNVIVTAAGRNVSPEWVEETITADRRVRRCVVVEHEKELVALIVPSDSALCHDFPALHDVLTFAARDLPAYAKPRRYLTMSERHFRDLDLLTANFRPRRPEVGRVVFDRSHALFPRA